MTQVSTGALSGILCARLEVLFRKMCNQPLALAAAPIYSRIHRTDSRQSATHLPNTIGMRTTARLLRSKMVCAGSSPHALRPDDPVQGPLLPMSENQDKLHQPDATRQFSPNRLREITARR